MKHYTFFWSPEGRQITTIEAPGSYSATVLFQRRNPQYRKVMGEVYWVCAEELQNQA